MIRTYALDPDVVRDGMALTAFVKGLGVENGRLMAEFPRKWIRMALEGLAEIESARDRARVESLLVQLRTNALLKTRVGVDYDGARSWLQNAVQNSQQFSAVICPDEVDVVQGSRAVHHASELLEDVDFWRSERRVEYRAEPGTLGETLQPLLRLDSMAVIMDPYFDPTRRAFQEALHEIAGATPSLSLIVVHSSATPTVGRHIVPTSEWEHACRANLQRTTVGGITVRVVRWRAGVSGERPHERWLANRMGGVILDRGIALDRQTNTASLMPALDVARLWRRFGQNPFAEVPYELQDDVTLHPEQLN